MRMSNALELHAISKRFVVGTSGCRGSVEALRSIDLCVEPGEAVAVVGGAGAGKSTLLLIAAGLLRADAGDIAWFGNADRTMASSHATYYFAGAVSANPTNRKRPQAPHLHLVDGLASLRLTTLGRIERWLSVRRANGDAVLIAERSSGEVQGLVHRVLALRAGRMSDAVGAVPSARVAEPLERSRSTW